MKNIVIFGATSTIAQHVARLHANDGDNLYLLARDQQKLSIITQDLQIRGAQSVSTALFDAEELTSHHQLINDIFKYFNHIDCIFIAHGSLSNQTECQSSASHTLQQLTINASSIISILTPIANKMEKQQDGNITVISSVAGDRGRQSNYVYGAAKSLVSTFLQGLAQRLSKSNVHVLDIKPGFVETQMTAELTKNILWSSPEYVAKIIKKRIESKSLFSYVPWFWFIIMAIIKFIPAKIFNRSQL
ncbi:SDR family oxidoreductase [Photobacterium kishitanii]|uniref:SDR family oxidoreductase n=1 Tax=Photobacterium kishitanii TaxID=318456 RepID=UPI000D168277|nr:SDR family oxidoreductase [Photobacterium kishitanii]PSU20307.1 short-chain dehydrogenase [Photobacterium kishitanii]